MPPIDFAIETIHFRPPRDGQRTEHVPQRTNGYNEKSLQEQTEIEVLDEIVEISIKFLTFSYSAVPRKYTQSFLLSIFFIAYSECLQEIADSASCYDHTPQCHN